MPGELDNEEAKLQRGLFTTDGLRWTQISEAIVLTAKNSEITKTNYEEIGKSGREEETGARQVRTQRGFCQNMNFVF
jgi:hypothetical protein